MPIYIKWDILPGAPLQLIAFDVTCDRGNQGVGRPALSEIKITKKIDAASPMIMSACGAGGIKSDAIIYQKLDDGQDFLQYKIKDVIASAYNAGGTSGDNSPVENVSLTFSKIALTVADQGGGG